MKSRNERATMYTQTEYPQTDSGQNGLDGVQAANSQSSEALEMSPQLFLLGRKAPERAQIEAYIANKFSSTYGATLREFLPFFLIMRARREISGVLGMRRGSHGHALFVEQYMDKPAERLLGEILGRPVERSSLVEIGNLVSTWRGSSQMLFIALASLICRSRVGRIYRNARGTKITASLAGGAACLVRGRWPSTRCSAGRLGHILRHQTHSDCR